MVATRVETESGAIYLFAPAGPVTRVERIFQDSKREAILESIVDLETGKPLIATVRLADFSKPQDPYQTMERVCWESTPVKKIQIFS